MADAGNFDHLVSGLSLKERHNLLEKLKGHSALSDEPLYVEDKSFVPASGAETDYSSLPWYYRIWYLILSFFESKDPIKIYKDNQVAVLGGKIAEKAPGLYDYHNGTLLPLFYRQLKKLKEAAHFFYSALDTGVHRDKGAFFAFLGSLEMADIHSRLQEETEPSFFAEKYPEKQEMELRQMAFKAIDDTLTRISDDHRSTMYFDSRSLNCLMELSSFLYDRALMAFNFESAANGETCSVNVVRELLISLNNILFSLKVTPPMTLMESLFVFVLHEKTGEPGLDINREIRLLLSKAEASLAVIREFNKRVPLTWILRCATKNMSLSPRETSGGEDWFVVYRDYWKRRVESVFSDYLKDRRQNELVESFRHFLKGKDLKTIENIQTSSNSEGLPIRGGFALSFLYTFYSVVFMPDINWILRPILIDGEFQKKENHIEFAESYNNLIKLEDEIKKFEQNISPAGDYGERYALAKQEMSSLPVKRRKIQIVLEEAQEDVGKILEQVRNASANLINILSGIFERETKGKYCALLNLTKIAGKDDHFIAGIGEKIQQFHTILKILDDIEATEPG